MTKEIVTRRGEIYELSDESYGPTRSNEMLFRTLNGEWIIGEGNWNIETQKFYIQTYSEATDGEVGMILIELQDIVALKKYGLSKESSNPLRMQDSNHGGQDDDGKESTTVGQQINLSWPKEAVRKLMEVQVSLVDLAQRLDNNPAEREEVRQCIIDLQAVEKIQKLSDKYSQDVDFSFLLTWFKGWLKRRLQSIIETVQKNGEIELAKAITEIAKNLFSGS